MIGKTTGLEHKTPVRIKATSATERATFRRCHRQWLLGIVQRLGSVEGNANFWFGTMIHAALAKFYELQGTLSYESRVDAAMETYVEHYERTTKELSTALGFLWSYAETSYKDMGVMGEGMLLGYFEQEKGHEIVKVLSVETRVNVPIRSKSGRKIGELSCQFDLTGTDQHGDTVIVDHKTASREHNSSQLDLDDQLTAYIWAYFQRYGVIPRWAIYNELLKKVAKPPKELKPGKDGKRKLSMDKQQVTTYALYRAAIEEIGADYHDYTEMLQYLLDSPPELFKREGVMRTAGQLEEFERNLGHEWADMRAVAAHPERAYPSPSPFNCPSCSVKMICAAMMNQEDVSTIIRDEFIVLEPRY